MTAKEEEWIADQLSQCYGMITKPEAAELMRRAIRYAKKPTQEGKSDD